MPDLNGTQTHANLKEAFAGESQANRRGERKRKRPNRIRVIAGRRCVLGVVGPHGWFCRASKESKSVGVSRRTWEGPAQRVIPP
jgi:hypothetical protein